MTPKIKALIEALATYCDDRTDYGEEEDLWAAIDAAMEREEGMSDWDDTAKNLRALLPSDDSPPAADPKLLALANAALHEQLQRVTAERDEARLAVLAAADDIDRGAIEVTARSRLFEVACGDGERWDFAPALRRLAGGA